MLPGREDIDHLQRLLAEHRRTLAILLQQRADLGADHAPPGVIRGIADARAAILDIKKELRGAGVDVADELSDEPDALADPRQARLRALLADHSAFMRDRLESFVGREWELAEIRGRIAGQLPTGGYVTIAGQAGQGKSSILKRNPQQWREVIRPALGLLLAAREPLALRAIRDLLGVEDDALRDGLRRLGGLVAQDGAGRYYLYHLKLQEHLRQDERRPNKDYLFSKG